MPDQDPSLTSSPYDRMESNDVYHIDPTETPLSLESVRPTIGEMSLPIGDTTQDENHNLGLSSENLPVIEELSSVAHNRSSTTRFHEEIWNSPFGEPFKPNSQEESFGRGKPSNVVKVSVPHDQRTWLFSEYDEKEILDWARTVFSASGRSDLLASWDSAQLEEAFLEMNVLFERVQWVVPVQVENNTVGMIGIEPSGELGWLNPSHGKSLRESLDDARIVLEGALAISVGDPQELLSSGGKHYWFFNTSLGQYFLDVLSPSPLEMALLEEQSSAKDGGYMQPRAQGNTQIQPDTAPWFYQGSKSWCGPYSTTTVLAWWGDPVATYDHDQSAYDIAGKAQGRNPPDPNTGTYIGTLDYAVDRLTDFKTVWHGEMKSIWSSSDNSPWERRDLKDWIHNGYPVIIEVDVDGSSGTTGDLHASVITGYNDNTQTVYVHDPSGAWTWYGGDTWASYSNLEKRWGAWDNHNSLPWPFSCYGFPDKDTPGDWLHHCHKHPGFVIYPGDLDLTSPIVSSSSLPSSVLDDEVVSFTVFLETSNQDAAESGIHAKVSGGQITGYSTSQFSVQAYDSSGNSTSLPAPIVEFTRWSLSSGTVYQATVYVEPISIGTMTIQYRGWATDVDDKVHCNYDFSRVNPWETRHHTVSVIDDSFSSPISMPSVEPWVARNPWSWADDRWNEVNFTWYETRTRSTVVQDDDSTPPSFSNASALPTTVYDSEDSDINISVEIADLESGVSEVGFRYRFGTGTWTSWDVWNLSESPRSFTISRTIGRNEWIGHVGDQVYFELYAVDDDNDRPNDNLTAYSHTYNSTQILDDDISSPGIESFGGLEDVDFMMWVRASDGSGWTLNVEYNYSGSPSTVHSHQASTNATTIANLSVTVPLAELAGHLGETIHWRFQCEDRDDDRINDTTGTNWSGWMKGIDVTDKIPPQTIHTLSGNLGTEDWFISEVTVTLLAWDEGGSGVNHTMYSLNYGSWQVYGTPIVIGGDGLHVAQFYSVDLAGNAEDVKSIGIRIDVNHPEIASTNPADRDEVVDRGIQIVIRFSEPMNTTSVEAALSVSPILDIKSCEWSENNTVLELTTSQNLEFDTKYAVTVGVGAKDIAGNSLLDPYVWTFDTEKTFWQELGWFVALFSFLLVISLMLLFMLRKKKGEETQEMNGNQD